MTDTVKKYDLIIIGAGTSGIVAAFCANKAFKKILLVDKNSLGENNIYKISYPINSLLSISNRLGFVRQIDQYNIKLNSSKFNMSRFKKLIDENIELFSSNINSNSIEQMGIEFIKGVCKFIGKKTVIINNQKYFSEKIIICSGMKNHIPEIKGLDKIKYLFPNDILNLKKIPSSALICGCGRSAVEVSTLLSGFGCHVTIICPDSSILPQIDPDMVEIIKKNLTLSNINLMENVHIREVKQSSGKVSIISNKQKFNLPADKVIICHDKIFDGDDLQLEKTGIEFSKNGIKVNKYLESNISGIFAAGDITGKYQFNNAAEAEAMAAALNSYKKIKRVMRYDQIPFSVNCGIEYSSFGFSETDAVKKYKKNVRIYKFPLKYSVKAIVDMNIHGAAKIICKKNGKILGASIIADSAVELIHQLMFLRKMKLPFYKLSFQNAVFPSYFESIRQPAKICLIDNTFSDLRTIILNIFSGKIE